MKEAYKQRTRLLIRLCIAPLEALQCELSLRPMAYNLNIGIIPSVVVMLKEEFDIPD